MGIFDNVSAAVNRGTAATARATRKMKLQGQLGDVNKRRQGLAAQLGASLYEVTKDNPELREGRESLYDGIASCDVERENLQRELAEIEQLAAASAAAVHTFNCCVCGARMSEADLFCSGCGTPVEQARPRPVAQTYAAAPQTGPVCPACNAPIEEGDAFCMNCGASLAAFAAAPEPAQVQPEPVQQPVSSEAEVAAAVESVPAADAAPAVQEQQAEEISHEVDDQPVAAGEEAPGLVVEEVEASQESESVVEETPATETDPEGGEGAQSEVQPAAETEAAAAAEPQSEPQGELKAEPEVAPVAQAASCPSCGKPVRENDRFCMNCGQRL